MQIKYPKYAHILLRKSIDYPVEATVEGLRRLGIITFDHMAPPPNIKDSIVITWSNYGTSAKIAREYKRRGCDHYIMENGYIGKDAHGNKLYTVAKTDYQKIHFTNKDSKRFNSFGHKLITRTQDNESPILVCGQRGGNYAPWAMHNDWPDKIIKKIRGYTERKVIYRPHPGKQRMPKKGHHNLEIASHEIPLIDLIDECSITIVYASNSAHESLLRGVPIYSDYPQHITRRLSVPDLSFINKSNAVNDKVINYFNNLAWQIYSENDLRCGLPWRVYFEGNSVQG